MLVKRRAFIVIRTECTHTVWRVLWWGTAKAKVAKAEIKHDTLFFPTIVIKIFGLKLFSTYAVKSQIYSYSIFHNTHCFSFTNKKTQNKTKKKTSLISFQNEPLNVYTPLLSCLKKHSSILQPQSGKERMSSYFPPSEMQ